MSTTVFLMRIEQMGWMEVLTQRYMIINLNLLMIWTIILYISAMYSFV